MVLKISESKRRKIEDEAKGVTRSDEKDKNHVDTDKKEKSAKLDRKRVSTQKKFLLRHFCCTLHTFW